MSRCIPSEYHYENYAPGDKAAWIAIEKSAKEFTTDEAGEAAWSKYFAPYEKELRNRMFFVADSSGRKLATASAYFDIYTGDDGETGWLHWVAVHSDAQGKGLSKPLITHVLAHMKKLGYKRAVIPTQTNTWLACKLYLDLGFVPTKENAQSSRMGWRIIRTLTDHPALDEFEPVDDLLGADPVRPVVPMVAHADDSRPLERQRGNDRLVGHSASGRLALVIVETLV